MVRVDVEHRFGVSIHQGFDYITEPANWPAYWPRFVCLDPESRWRAPGDRARLTLRILAREADLEMTLARLERYRVVETRASNADFQRLGTGATSKRPTVASPTRS